MSNYKETSITSDVKKWNALRQGILDNPYNSQPLLTMYEVERTTLDGELIKEQPTGRSLSVAVQNEGILIPYINPDTYEQILDPQGNPVEGMCFTDEQFAYMVACAYIYAAKEADKLEALQSTQEEPVVPEAPTEPPVEGEA
jgi:hypothetical protein